MRQFLTGAIFLVIGAIPAQAQIIQLSCDIPCGDCAARGKVEIRINESLGTATVYYPEVKSVFDYQLITGSDVFRLRRQSRYAKDEYLVNRINGAVVHSNLDINSSNSGTCSKASKDAKVLF